MKQILLTLLSIITFLGAGLAQEHNHVHCGYDHVLESMNEKFPGYKAAFDAQFLEAKKSMKSYKQDEILTVNCIIHIVYNEEFQNLPMSLIDEVMESVNKDFRGENDDLVNVRNIFKPLVGSTNIQFIVDSVIRVQTNTEFEFGGLFGNNNVEDMKFSDKGGSDTVDPDKYLNIWVADIKGGLLGLAYPPVGADNWPEEIFPEKENDGVIVATVAFHVDTTFTIVDEFLGGETILDIRAKTVSHEIGHYLGLRHIWGDANFFEDGCAIDDGIDDTPIQGTSTQFICDTTLNTCESGTGDFPDMIENHMDYASETCPRMFTAEQSQIMRYNLINFRSGLLGSVNNSELDHTGSISIFPNPVYGGFFEISQDGLPVYSLELVNSSGQVLANRRVNAGTRLTKISTSSFESGLYFALIRNEQGELIQSEKLIIGN